MEDGSRFHHGQLADIGGNLAIRQEPVDKFWNFFLAIEDDVAVLSRYIEFDSNNMQVYSMEIARLLFVVASEVDVCAKLLCKAFDPESDTKNIGEHREVVMRYLPEIAQQEVMISRFGLTFCPWENWGVGRKPEWWGASTDVKHHRVAAFHKATLGAVLNALAGLFLLVIHLAKKGSELALRPVSKLLEPDGVYASLDVMPSGPVVFLRT